MNITELDISSVTPHDGNVRRDLGDLTELADSIKAQGILQPITVAPAPDGYVIIAGHRRHAAATHAGHNRIPAIIRTDLDTPIKQIEAMLTENLQRADLTISEEAAAYQQLELLGVPAAKIAKATGRSKATISNRLKLLALPQGALARVDSGQISLDDALTFAAYSGDQEAEEIIASGDTVSDIKWRLRMLTDRRERAAARADDDTSNPGPTVDAAKAAAADTAAAEHRAAWQQRQQIIQASAASIRDWIIEQITTNPNIADDLATLAITRDLNSYDDYLAPFGITPAGDDDDINDWIATTTNTIAAWPTSKKLAALAYDLLSIGQLPTWRYGDTLTEFIALGYPASSDEQALLNDPNQPPF